MGKCSSSIVGTLPSQFGKVEVQKPTMEAAIAECNRKANTGVNYLLFNM
jgi:hypothetical protein